MVLCGTQNAIPATPHPKLHTFATINFKKDDHYYSFKMIIIILLLWHGATCLNKLIIMCRHSQRHSFLG